MISPSSALIIRENEPDFFTCTTPGPPPCNSAPVHFLTTDNNRIDQHNNTGRTTYNLHTNSTTCSVSITIHWPANESARRDLNSV